MKNLLFVITIALIPVSLHSQESVITIRGKIIDIETNEPLPFANVVFSNGSFGTVSDLNGIFTFTISSVPKDDSVTISYVGYQSISLDTKSFADNLVIIPLSRDKKQLNSVTIETVNDESLKDIIKHIKKHFIGKMRETPHIAKAHYRETVQVENTYKVFMESVGYVVYLGENQKVAPFAKNKFFCENSRCIYPLIPLDESKLKHPNSAVGPREALKFRYFGPLSTNHFSFKLADKTFQKNRGYLIIKFSNRKISNRRLSTGYIKVDAENLHVVEVNYQTNGLSSILNSNDQGEVSIRYVYINEEPFVGNVETSVNKNDITHRTTYNLMTQKLNEFSLTSEEFWSFNHYERKPFIYYDKATWDQYGIALHPDHKNILNDLGGELSFDEKINKKSGTWFTEPHNSEIERLKLAQKKVGELKAFFQ